ncbi:hypothetical protein DFH06DRAFT_992336 [Mycena polygramma]|nr:hypothetical protein DFH06DRAFT_992336 [Mycena polygramma]
MQSRSIPPPPQTQARRSTTFAPPALDGSLTIPQIYNWHSKNTSFHRLFVYTRQDGTTRTIYWPEAVQAVYVGAQILRNRFDWTAGTSQMPVVSVLASSDTIPYFTVLMSCLRANYVAFPISPRNSPAAIAHLISKAEVKHLLIGHEVAMADLANSAIQILKEEYPVAAVPDVSLVPLFDELFLPASNNAVSPEDLPYENMGSDAIACIMHSSGSTAFPKPIYWSNHRTIETALIPWFGERDLTDTVLSLHSMPMYHGMGILQMFWSAACGSVLSAFEPASPPTIPTPENLFHAAKATNTDVVFCVPSFIEAWSREPEYVKWLATRGGVLYGGGPLNKHAGDYMTSQGVSIFVLYGSSEGGIMSPILPSEVGYDWDYFKFPGLVTPEMIPHGNDTFELVMVTNEFCRPAVLNMQIRGIDAYATSDLLLPHPTKPGYWKIYGRTDDQIIHNTGEKTNPGPLENILNQDPHVLSAVMFGRGRFQAGVVVDPKEDFKIDPSDLVKLAEFRNLIWPTVQKMNLFSPQHSRIFKEMILVSNPMKPFTYTAKNTARRQAIIDDYEDEIAELYNTVEQTTQAGHLRLESWDPLSTLDFVRDVVFNVMPNKVHDDEDLFQHGCDSLQATWIRNSLLHALRDSAQLDTRHNTHNFVYDHPTISRLADYIFGMASGTVSEEASVMSKTSAMHEMVARYTQNFPTHQGEQKFPPATEKVVLITGTTGELGCYLLSQLLADDNVAQVYALNRTAVQQPALRERQGLTLLDRGLDAGILDSPKLLLLEGDTGKTRFDLNDSVYRQMQQTVTHIIHTAWPVDFNLALRSFEPNILGVRNLIDFSLRSPLSHPPTLLYTSSIGILHNVHSKNPIPEALVDAAIAIGSGYQESKWIAEQLLVKAAECAPGQTLVVRVGQLSGGINGAWNAQEWVPALVQSAKILQCIPDDGRNISWIPVHTAAAAIVDFLDAPETKLLHLIHPRSVPWSNIASAIANDLGVPLVPYADWLTRLENAAKTEKAFRAPRLLGFFQSASRHTSEEYDAFGFPKLDMSNALKASETLRRSATSPTYWLGGGDVEKWMGYWQSVGLF